MLISFGSLFILVFLKYRFSDSHLQGSLQQARSLSNLLYKAQTVYHFFKVLHIKFLPLFFLPKTFFLPSSFPDSVHRFPHHERRLRPLRVVEGRSIPARLLDSSKSLKVRSLEIIPISSLNMKDFPGLLVEGGTAFVQKVVPVLKTRTESRRSQKFATTFTATDHPFLVEAGMAQVRQTVKASTPKDAYAASGARAAQWFFTLLREKVFFSTFLNESTFL